MEDKITYFTDEILAVLDEKIKTDEKFLNEIAENTTEFIHALANVVPTTVYDRLIEEIDSFLEFNHIANKLCFEFMKREE